jgi:hypothetical protein
MKAKGNDFQCAWHILQRKACALTSFAPIESWHFMRHSSRSFVAKHKLAARGRREGGGDIRNADTISVYMDCVDPHHLHLGCDTPNWNIHNDLFPVPTSQRLERTITFSNLQS